MIHTIIFDSYQDIYQRSAQAHYVYGLYHRHKGDQSAAEAEFKAALKLEPDHAPAKQALARR